MRSVKDSAWITIDRRINAKKKEEEEDDNNNNKNNNSSSNNGHIGDFVRM